MRGDEEEILIRDDSGLLYDDSVTVSVRPRPADWCHKITKTLCLSLAFFVLVSPRTINKGRKRQFFLIS